MLDEENRNMKSKLRDSQGITLVVVLMVMAILLSVVGAGLLFSGINTKISGNYQTGSPSLLRRGYRDQRPRQRNNARFFAFFNRGIFG